MHKAPALPKTPMLAIAFAQGICLYLLYRAFDNNTWPSESPLWFYPLLTLAVAVPVLLPRIWLFTPSAPISKSSSPEPASSMVPASRTVSPV